MLSDIRLSDIMLSVIYAECHLCCVSFMQSVANEPIMLSAIMMNVIVVGVVAPLTFASLSVMKKNVL
jgi:hypothetical protein